MKTGFGKCHEKVTEEPRRVGGEMKTIAITILILATAPAFAQQHAPTTQQCQADVRIWIDEADDWNKAEATRMNSATPNLTAVNKMAIQEINKRAAEMGKCVKVDPQNRADYRETWDYYENVYYTRLEHFVIRNHLYEQFSNEDAAGQR